ncbi:MAG TPA: hypothetical protein VI455_19030 [Terriglobia bacterium]
MCFVAVLGATASVASVEQGAITGHVIVTKVLTKKRVTLPSYQLRGVSTDVSELAKPGGAHGSDELTQVVVYLEGPGLLPAIQPEPLSLRKTGTLTPRSSWFR